MPPSAHHEYGPSSLNYRAQCRAWKNRGGSSPASDEGQLMHRAVETGILDALDPEQERQVQTVLDTINPMIARATEVCREVRLDVTLSSRQDTFGTCDLRLRGMDGDPNKETIIDYKFGRLPVPPATQNRQAWAYAIGVFQDSAASEVTAVFIQPRLGVVDVAKFTRAIDYPRMIRSLATLIKECKAKKPKRTACKACEYCARITKCPTVASVIETAVKPAGFAGHYFIDGAGEPISMMSADKLDSAALPLARLAETWAKDVKDQAKALLEGGAKMDHHELGQRSVARKLTGSTWDAYAKLPAHIDVQTFLSACSLSVSQLEQSCKKRKIDPSKFKEFVNALVTASLLDPAENPKQPYLKRKAKV